MVNGKSVKNLIHHIKLLTKRAFLEITDYEIFNRIKSDKFRSVTPLNLKQEIHFIVKSKSFDKVVQAVIDIETFLLETQPIEVTSETSEQLSH